MPIRAFSTNLKDNKDDQGKEDDKSTHNEEDLLGEDAVSEDKVGSLEGEKEKGAKEEGAEEKGASSSTSFDASSFIPSGYEVRQSLLAFSDGVKETWHELINPDRSSNFKKRIAEPMSKGESDARKDEHGEYAGPSELMMVKGEKDAWERMRARMASAPIIEDVLKAAGKVYSSEGVKKTREKLGDISEDAREAWETSQNPWVYRISSIIDTFSAEDEFAVAVRELRRLDPNFDMEDWRYNLGEAFLIPFIRDYMRSDLKALKPWIHGEGMKRKIEGEIRTRKQEGVRFDENVTSTEPEHLEVIAAQLDPNERGSPIILVQFVLQQINCIYSLKSSDEDGEKIMQGSPDEIRQNVYLMGFQRIFDEETGELIWKVVDLQLHMGEQYI
ncbi:hypothetical protein TrCOL_g1053 [Triparma columacea]|uniref:Tim44-like domain-containing protein n=1 Tax=Triparma columacea TaxID=722753 RepID=A0A9W7FXX6_9STRA|nr:hypothetical protein TrCOL_g1053 [Triparma columacea]